MEVTKFDDVLLLMMSLVDYKYIEVKVSEPEWSNERQVGSLTTRRILGTLPGIYMAQNVNYSKKFISGILRTPTMTCEQTRHHT